MFVNITVQSAKLNRRRGRGFILKTINLITAPTCPVGLVRSNDWMTGVGSVENFLSCPTRCKQLTKLTKGAKKNIIKIIQWLTNQFAHW